MGDTPRIPVKIHGMLRGASFDAHGAVRIVDDVVAIHVDDREYTTRIDRVDGVVWEPPVLTVHVGYDTLELTGHAGLQPFGAQIVSTALALPEFTRTMRGLGSRRGHVGGDHDRFFAGFLAARRAAESLTEPESRLAAFDPQRLATATTALIAELASERYPESAPDRRALEAELLEHAERLHSALDALGETAEQVRTSGHAGRLARWRAWTRAVLRVFEEADRSWIAMVPALTASPVPVAKRRFWRQAKP